MLRIGDYLMEISKCLGGSKLEEDEEQAHKRTK